MYRYTTFILYFFDVDMSKYCITYKLYAVNRADPWFDVIPTAIISRNLLLIQTRALAFYLYHLYYILCIGTYKFTQESIHLPRDKKYVVILVY